MGISYIIYKTTNNARTFATEKAQAQKSARPTLSRVVKHSAACRRILCCCMCFFDVRLLAKLAYHSGACRTFVFVKFQGSVIADMVDNSSTRTL